MVWYGTNVPTYKSKMFLHRTDDFAPDFRLSNFGGLYLDQHAVSYKK